MGAIPSASEPHRAQLSSRSRPLPAASDSLAMCRLQGTMACLDAAGLQGSHHPSIHCPMATPQGHLQQALAAGTCSRHRQLWPLHRAACPSRVESLTRHSLMVKKERYREEHCNRQE